MTTTSSSKMYDNHLPSFISVYSMDSPVQQVVCWSSSTPKASESFGNIRAESLRDHRLTKKFDNSNNIKTVEDTQIFHDFSKESSLSSTSCSCESSPTTTISTLDSSVSDPSPSISPDSPCETTKGVSCLALDPVLLSNRKVDMTISPSSRLPTHNKTPLTSPNGRRKNPKSLALNLSPTLESCSSSEPPSPSFIRPPAMKGKRKPNLLTLNTGAANSNLRGESIGSPGFSSMFQRRGLERSISTPRMSTTPMHGPAGGMTLWPQLGSLRFGMKKFSNEDLNNVNQSSGECTERSNGVQMATRLPGVTVGGDAFDRAQSAEDANSGSYPDGPILMYEPNVYLYSEPKLEEILNFDVVINVAREVKCPIEFDEMDSQYSQRPTHLIIPKTNRSLSDSGLGGSVPMSSMSTTSENKRLIRSIKQSGLPEYIHVLWDHNTDVKDELWDLCELIQARSKMGKKVLVHCHQGASRSATLIIAYGMFINQDIGPNESHQIAQSKSPWVNPNMSLLFSLNDFKKIINEKKMKSHQSGIYSPKCLTIPLIEAVRIC